MCVSVLSCIRLLDPVKLNLNIKYLPSLVCVCVYVVCVCVCVVCVCVEYISVVEYGCLCSGLEMSEYWCTQENHRVKPAHYTVRLPL